MQKKLSGIIILLVTIWSNVSAQEPIHYSTADGLPSNIIYDCVQDKKGYMWFATDVGVVKYDGEIFKYLIDKQQKIGNDVIQLQYDTINNIIWGTTIDLVTFYIKNDSIIIGNKKQIPPKSVNRILPFTIAQSNNGTLFLFDSLIYKIDRNCYEALANIVYNISYIYFVFETTDTKSYLFFTNKDVLKYDKSSKKIDKINFPYSDQRIVEYYFHNDSIVYFSTLKGIYKLKINDNGDLELINKQIFSAIISGIEKTENGLLIATRSGELFEYNYNLDQLHPFFLQKNYGDISTILIDKHQNLWICTMGDGIFLYPNYQQEVAVKKLKMPDVQYNLVLKTANGQLFAAAQRGIIYNEKGKQIYKDKYQLETRQMQYNDKWGLIAINDNNIIQYRKNKITTINKQWALKSFDFFSDSLLLLGSASDLILYNFYTQKVVKMLCEKRIYQCIYFPKQGIIYYTDNNGLNKINYNKNADTSILIFAIKKTIQLKKQLNELGFWMLTTTNGLYNITNDKITAHFFVPSDFSQNERIKYIDIDEHRNILWLALDNGIKRIKFDINNQKKKYYEWNFWGNITGQSIYYSDSITYIVGNNIIYTIKDPKTNYIKDYKIDILIAPEYGQFQNEDTFISNTGLSKIAIKCNVPFFGQNKKNIYYKYRFLSTEIVSDSTWKLTSFPIFEIENIKPGNYIFEVEAWINQEKISSAKQKIFIEIPIVFIQTIWYKILKWILIIVIIALLVYFISLYYYNRKLRILENKIRISRAEINAIKAQLNPHFIYNSLHTIQNYINQNDQYNANIFIVSFAKLVRKTLEFSGVETVSIQEEIAYLENYIILEQMSYEKTIKFSVNIANNISANEEKIPAMLLQPFVENALKHGLSNPILENPTLTISFEKNLQKLICKIDDNGIGRKETANKERQYQSKATKLIDDRLKLMRKSGYYSIDYHIIDKADTAEYSDNGTLVIIQIEEKKSQ